MRKKFEGIFTAIATPFKRDNIDYDAFSKFVEWQIQQGVSGLVLCGTTGEAHSLSDKEYDALIKLAIEINNDRVQIIVGVPSNSTRKIISIVNKIKSDKISAFLITPPYYLQPTQEGIYQHFKEICEKTEHPIIAYNIPHRCGIEINNETFIKIMELENIVGIKDATGDLEKPLIYRMYNSEISLLSGNDATYLSFRVNGGDGCISVISNLIPKFYSELHNIIDTDIKLACKMNSAIFPLIKAIFSETNPIPVKYALSLIKKYILPDVRLPLTPATDNTKKIIQEYLYEFNKINGAELAL